MQGATRALAVVTAIFFMWGFLTCLNDILIPHLKAAFALSWCRRCSSSSPSSVPTS